MGRAPQSYRSFSRTPCVVLFSRYLNLRTPKGYAAPNIAQTDRTRLSVAVITDVPLARATNDCLAAARERVTTLGDAGGPGSRYEPPVSRVDS
jgi:hypothetical protein